MSERTRYAAIVEQDGRVLCVRPANAAGDAWEFPSASIEGDETPEQALSRMLEGELGVRPRSLWYYDSFTTATDGGDLNVDCYVCPLDDASEVTQGDTLESRWLSQAELLDPQWTPSDREVATSLGVFWGQAFAPSHL